MRKTTIRDIAKMANVSVASVSYVLNGKSGVGPETRERIQEIIEKTGFKKNIHSKRLMENRSYNIALLIQPTSSPFQDLFYYEVMQGLLDFFQAENYNLIFCQLQKDQDGAYIIPRAITEGDCDGIALFQDITDAFLTKIRKSGIATVVIDSHAIPANTHCVRVDNRELCRLATQHLVNKGHRHIGFIGNSNLPTFYTASFKGYSDALSANHINMNTNWILSDSYDEQKAYEQTDRLLSKHKAPTAFLCSGDQLAIGAMRAVKAFGLHIPADISFIGVDDIVLSRYIEPALTTIKIEKKQLGIQAGRLLLQAVNDPAVSPTVLTLKMDKVLERQSIKQL